MPVPAAQYAALLARAVPGLTFHEIENEISIAKGWSLIHASCLLHGEAMVWPHGQASRVGWIDAVRRHLQQQRIKK